MRLTKGTNIRAATLMKMFRNGQTILLGYSKQKSGVYHLFYSVADRRCYVGVLSSSTESEQRVITILRSLKTDLPPISEELQLKARKLAIQAHQEINGVALLTKASSEESQKVRICNVVAYKNNYTEKRFGLDIGTISWNGDGDFEEFVTKTDIIGKIKNFTIQANISLDELNHVVIVDGQIRKALAKRILVSGHAKLSCRVRACISEVGGKPRVKKLKNILWNLNEDFELFCTSKEVQEQIFDQLAEILKVNEIVHHVSIQNYAQKKFHLMHL